MCVSADKLGGQLSFVTSMMYGFMSIFDPSKVGTPACKSSALLDISPSSKIEFRRLTYLTAQSSSIALHALSRMRNLSVLELSDIQMPNLTSLVMRGEKWKELELMTRLFNDLNLPLSNLTFLDLSGGVFRNTLVDDLCSPELPEAPNSRLGSNGDNPQDVPAPHSPRRGGRGERGWECGCGWERGTTRACVPSSRRAGAGVLQRQLPCSPGPRQLSLTPAIPHNQLSRRLEGIRLL